jgi:DNA-binding NarL/FixJ family response regulator
MTTLSNGQAIRVLLADDHAMLLDMWCQLLSKDECFQLVGKARDGQEAVDKSRQYHPHVVVMDINMQPLNGFEATRLVRQYSPATRVVGVSMYNLPAYARKLIAAGASGFVTKFSPVEELYEAILTVGKGGTYVCQQLRDQVSPCDDPASATGKQLAALTRRELDIAELVCDGLTTSQIAEKLFLSQNTVNSHRFHIFKKLGVKNVVELLHVLQEAGF